MHEVVASFPGAYEREAVALFHDTSVSDVPTFPHDVRMEVDDESFRAFMHRVCHLSAHVFMKYCMRALKGAGIRTAPCRDLRDRPFGPSFEKTVREPGVYRVLASAHGPRAYENEYTGKVKYEKGSLHDFVVVTTGTRRFLVQTDVYKYTKTPKVDVRPIPDVGDLFDVEGLRRLGLGILTEGEDPDPQPYIYQASGVFVRKT